jgi:hypothetical protein
MDNCTYRVEAEIVNNAALAVNRNGDNFGMGSDKDISRLPCFGVTNENSPRYFPASSVIGCFRDACVDAVRDVLRKGGREDRFTLEQAFMNYQGTDITGKVNAEGSGGFDENVSLQKANPLLSCLGRWKVPKKFGIREFVPRLPNSHYIEGRGYRKNPYNSDNELKDRVLLPSSFDDLTVFLKEQTSSAADKGVLNKEVKSLKSKVRNASPQDKEEINHRIKELDVLLAGVKEDRKFKCETVQRPCPGFEAFKPGTLFDHVSILNNVNLLELGIFLAGWRKFSENPVMGSHFGQGAGGDIQGTFKFYALKNGVRVEMGSMTLKMFEFSVEGDLLTSALERFEAVFADPESHDIDLGRFMR